ncbi:MAG: PEP-CTERM sorting domain-containing protein [Akkermansia sp.]|nr:PEP-CTERM sorting domain-containing protein [Akkermansia sp.]
MKKTIIALLALAGMASATTVWEDTNLAKGGDLYAAPFDFHFVISNSTVSGDYDILLAYYQTSGDKGYNVNAFELSSAGILTLNRGKNLTFTDGALTSDSVLTSQDSSTFVDAGGAAYVVTLPGVYKVDYLGGANGAAAADLYLDGVKVASFTDGNHNMNGSEGGGNELTFKVNSAYVVSSVPEPTTATLSLLALAGLAARRRRK